MIFYKVVIFQSEDGQWDRSRYLEHEASEGEMPFEIVDEAVTILRRTEELIAYCKNLTVLKSYSRGFFDAVRTFTNAWDTVQDKAEKLTIKKDIKQTIGSPIDVEFDQ